MKIIGGSSNKKLVSSLARELNLEKLNSELSTFPNGETKVWIEHTPEEIAGENIIVVQSFSQPVNTHVIETLLLIDALERLGARHITLLIPWFGYSLQDKVFRDGEPIAAKVIANLLSHSYLKRIFFLDLHNTSTTGFFAIPSHHISAMQIFTEYAVKNFAAAFKDNRVVAASPDFGGLKRARVFANNLSTQSKQNVALVNIDKNRNYQTGEVRAVQIQGGDVKGKVVLIMDDVINSGTTVIEVARLLKNEGASEVHFFATHGLFIDNAVEKLSNSMIDSIVISNTVNQKDLPNNFHILDITPIFAKELKSWI
jgi:ribose-phosphate pyrophosphokinase